MIEIRFMKEDDIDNVNIIRKQVFDLHLQGRPQFFRADAWDTIKDGARKSLEDENGDILIALKEGNVVGYAQIQYVHKPGDLVKQPMELLHVEEFGVDESHKGEGIGRELTEALKRIAKEKGFKTINLDVWEFNQGAIAFYDRVGFTSYRRHLEMDVD